MASTNLKHITCDPSILGGKPVIRGTRISVEFILELLHSGMALNDILKEYPHLKRRDLEAAIAFARHAVSREEVIHFELATAR
ncbi:DUF433 domain-containing protein [Candidatus Uhrbacteria bacterium]|nr:DUF433 domain-containing protein [Candidatus Uhrbacteria bacterium]